MTQDDPMERISLRAIAATAASIRDFLADRPAYYSAYITAAILARQLSILAGDDGDILK